MKNKKNKGKLIAFAPSTVWQGAEIIVAYSRAQAIHDGTLIDVTEMAKEAGFKFPVAVTAAVWNIIVPSLKQKERGQDIDGRLWDTLYMLNYAIKTNKDNVQDRLIYEVYYANDTGKPKSRKLKSVIGPGDCGEPVITIMLPDED